MPPEKAAKKPNKKQWLIIGGIVVAMGIIIIARKKKKSEEGVSTATSEQEALRNQSFIPVVGEGAGAGASFGGGFAAPSGESSQSLLLEYITSSQAHQEEHEKTEREFFSNLIANLGTGGGAPASNGAPGTVVAPAPPPSPPPVSAPPPPPAAKCPSTFPDWNPANGAPSPHSCYKYSRDRCSDKSHPYKHVYQDGHVVCSPT